MAVEGFPRTAAEGLAHCTLQGACAGGLVVGAFTRLNTGQ